MKKDKKIMTFAYLADADLKKDNYSHAELKVETVPLPDSTNIAYIPFVSNSRYQFLIVGQRQQHGSTFRGNDDFKFKEGAFIPGL